MLLSPNIHHIAYSYFQQPIQKLENADDSKIDTFVVAIVKMFQFKINHRTLAMSISLTIYMCFTVST